MKKILSLIITASLTLLTIVAPLAVQAQSNSQALCEGSGGTWTASNAPSGGTCSSTDGRTVPGTIQQVTDVLIFIVGSISVLMIIIGGVRYTTSAGDQTALTSAKNTVLYAIIGIIVSIMAYAIVHFIFGAFNIK